ncbi:MAG: transglycosylase SLT domain-containing protein [Clostridiales bacterium]|nr:transglycosylase SLT domain-containing protein [Clostridiales bacterium]
MKTETALCIRQPYQMQPAQPRNRSERRKREQARKKRLRTATIVATVSLAAGLLFGTWPTPAEADSTEKTASTVSSYHQYSGIDAETEELATATPLLQISLDADLQESIYALCGYDPELFCAVMAIANQETGFNAEAIGDSGNSIGLMQINIPAQADRIEALGVTDLTDPLQNAEVAIDYIAWIMAHDEAIGYDTETLYMAYNMGWRGSREAIAAGTTSTAYSREALASYQAFMEELEVGA